MIMMRRPVLPILLGLALVLAACGKKGPLLPPVSRVPQAPENIRIYQQGGQLMIEWTNPQSYVDGNPLGPVVEMEIWVWEPPAGEKAASDPPSPREMSKRGRLEKRLSAEDMENLKRPESPGQEAPVYRYVRPLGEGEIGAPAKSYALRARDQRRRPSAFSKPLPFEARDLPLPPRKPAAKVFEDRVEITWQVSESTIGGKKPIKASGYNVYKMDEAGVWRCLTDKPASALQYSDGPPVFGRSVRYIVRAVLSVPQVPQRFLESDDSEILELTPEDAFPPAAPEGLTSVSGRGFISISWLPNREKDLKGYWVWRRAAKETDFRLLTSDPIPQAVFMDEEVKPGRAYVYAVAAVDNAGNTSLRTELTVESDKDGP
jgi:predicted small lipoprotein YifL